MVWVKRSLAHSLSVFLFGFLVALVFAVTANQTFGQPQKLEAILHDSGIYNSLTGSLLKQAEQSKTGQDQVVSLNNPLVQQAAKATLTPALMEKSVNQFLDGNYAWLQGKTGKPTFSINLEQAKSTFVDQIGAATEQHLAALPVCTPEQVAQIDPNKLDYLSLDCRPPTVSAQAAKAAVQNQLTTGDFLQQPVLTPETLQQTDSTGIQTTTEPQTEQPYYVKLASAPTYYQLSQYLPWIFAILSLLCAAGVIFISATKRRGWRQVSVVLAGVGLLLIISKFLTDQAVASAQHSLLASPDANDFRQPIIDIMGKIESHMVSLNLLFGVIFLVIGVGLFAYLHFGNQPSAPNPTLPEPPAPTPTHEPPVSEPPAVTTPPATKITVQ